VRTSFLSEPRLTNSGNGHAEPFRKVFVVYPFKQAIRRFLEIHVCSPIDKRSAVHYTAYIHICKGSLVNRVPLARRVQIINCLVEGNSIRSTERMTGTHRDTICRLLVEVGDGCAKLMDDQMRELPCRRIEVDEIWAFVGKKQRHMTPLDDPRRVGDQYTFVALDPETKIVPAYRVGKRDLPTATAFITDLSERLANRVQLSSDALAAYVEATERAFGADIDYGQVVKFYEAEPVGRGRYSPPHVVGAERSVIVGNLLDEFD
jgi:IS1 family transposase